MNIPVVLDRARGLARFGSLYLISAGLVLAGGWLALHGPGGASPAALRQVLGSQIAYEACLVLILAVLRRARGETRDPLILAALLLPFALDVVLVQARYGWEDATGMRAATVGAASGIALVLAVAMALRVPLLSRPIGTLVAVIAFGRFAPVVLVAPLGADLFPRHVALGWLAAACLLPALLLPAASRPGDAASRRGDAASRRGDEEGAPVLRAIDRIGTAAGVVAVLVHFLPAGTSFSGSLRFAYLAPFLILLGPVIERLVPRVREVRAARLLTGGLSWVGLAAAASVFVPALHPAPWAVSWPLTPFTLALALMVVVQLARAWASRDVRLLHVAAALVGAALLGGDLPEILANVRYPQAWQALAAVAPAWLVIAWARRPVAGTALHALPAFVGAGWLDAHGVPWALAWVALLAWAPLVLTAAEREPDSSRASGVVRALMAATAAGVPVVVLLAAHDELVRAAFAAASCLALFLLAGLRRNRTDAAVATACSLVAVVGWPLSLQVHGEVNLGILLVELGFAVLLLAFVVSVAGGRVRGVVGRPD